MATNSDTLEQSLTLEDKDRSRLDDIVSKMEANNESEDDIRFVVNDFKSKYGRSASKKEDKISEAKIPEASMSDNGQLTPEADQAGGNSLMNMPKAEGTIDMPVGGKAGVDQQIQDEQAATVDGRTQMAKNAIRQLALDKYVNKDISKDGTEFGVDVAMAINPEQHPEMQGQIEPLPDEKKQELADYAAKIQQEQPNIVRNTVRMKKNPNDIDAINGLADASNRIGDKGEALSLYAKANSVSENYQSLNGIGSIYQANNQFDDAKSAYKDAIKINPDNVFAKNNLAYVNSLQGNFEESNKQLDALSKEYPDYSWPAALKAENLRKAGDEKGAAVADAEYKLKALWENMPEDAGVEKATKSKIPEGHVDASMAERIGNIVDWAKQTEMGAITGIADGLTETGHALDKKYTDPVGSYLGMVNGLLHTGFSAAMAATPEGAGMNLMFNAMPEEFQKVAFQPIDALLQLTPEQRNQLFSENGKLALDLLNTFGSIALFAGVHGAGEGKAPKYEGFEEGKIPTTNQLIRLKEQLKKTSMADVQSAREAYQSTPADMPTETRLKFTPYVLERKSLEAKKEAAAESFGPYYDKKLAEVDDKINAMMETELPAKDLPVVDEKKPSNEKVAEKPVAPEVPLKENAPELPAADVPVGEPAKEVKPVAEDKPTESEVMEYNDLLDLKKEGIADDKELSRLKELEDKIKPETPQEKPEKPVKAKQNGKREKGNIEAKAEGQGKDVLNKEQEVAKSPVIEKPLAEPDVAKPLTREEIRDKRESLARKINALNNIDRIDKKSAAADRIRGEIDEMRKELGYDYKPAKKGRIIVVDDKGKEVRHIVRRSPESIMAEKDIKIRRKKLLSENPVDVYHLVQQMIASGEKFNTEDFMRYTGQKKSDLKHVFWMLDKNAKPFDSLMDMYRTPENHFLENMDSHEFANIVGDVAGSYAKKSDVWKDLEDTQHKIENNGLSKDDIAELEHLAQKHEIENNPEEIDFVRELTDSEAAELLKTTEDFEAWEAKDFDKFEKEENGKIEPSKKGSDSQVGSDKKAEEVDDGVQANRQKAQSEYEDGLKEADDKIFKAQDELKAKADQLKKKADKNPPKLDLDVAPKDQLFDVNPALTPEHIRELLKPYREKVDLAIQEKQDFMDNKNNFLKKYDDQLRIDEEAPKKEDPKINQAIEDVRSGKMNADDAAVALDDAGIEVSDSGIYDKLRDAEKEAQDAGPPRVDDTVLVKGRNGNPDFEANFRGEHKGEYMVVAKSGMQFTVPKEDVTKVPKGPSKQSIIDAHDQMDKHIQEAQAAYDKASGERQKYIQENGYPAGGDAAFDKLVKATREAEDRLNQLKTAKSNLLEKPLSPKQRVDKAIDDIVNFMKDNNIINDDPNIQKSGVDVERLIRAAGEFIKQGIDLHGDIKKAVEHAIERLSNLPAFKRLEKTDQDKILGEVARVGKLKEDLPPTGINKAVREREREKRGEPQLQSESHTHEELLDRARTAIKDGSIDVRAIAEEISSGEARSLSPLETAAAVVYKTELETNINKANIEINKAVEEGDSGAELVARAKLKNLQEDRQAYDIMGQKTGYEQSLSFGLRRMMLDNEFSAVYHDNAYKAITGKEVPADVKARHEQYQRDYDAWKVEKQAYEDKMSRMVDMETIENIKKAIDREVEKSKKKGSLSPEKAKRKAELGIEIRSRFNDVTQILATVASKKGREYISLVLEEAVGDFKAFAKEMIATFGKEIKEHLPKIYKEFGGKEEVKVEDIQEGGNPKRPSINKNDKIVIPHEVLKDLVREGIDNVDDLTKAVHDMLKEDYPDRDFTEREVRDAITQYGKTINMSPDQINEKIRKAKRVGRLISQIEDVQGGKRPLRSGLQRDPITDQERRMQKELKEAMKDLPIDEADLQKQWKTSLDGIKTRLKNSIADLEHRIKTGEKPSEKKVVELDQEALDLKDQRDELKKQLQDIEGKPELSDEQKVKRAIKATEQAIDKLQFRIDTGELEAKKTKAPTSPELEAVRKTLDEKRQELKGMQEQAGILEKKRLEAYKESARKYIAGLEDRIKNKDFDPTPKRPKPILDLEGQKLEAQKADIKESFEIEKKKAEQAKRNRFEKTLDFLSQLKREMVISSVTSLGKLFTAANSRMVQTVSENVAGHVIHLLLSGLSKRALGEGGGFNPKAELAAVKKYGKTWGDFLGAKKGSSMWEIWNRGKSMLDKIHAETVLPDEFISYIGRSHGMLKDPVKQAEYIRAMTIMYDNASTMGLDLKDPVLVKSINDIAYLKARKSIFTNPVLAVKLYKGLLGSLEKRGGAVGRTIATASKIEMPVVSVPVNFANELLKVGFGGVHAAAKTLQVIFRHGLKNMTAAEADYIMSALKKQSVGAALYLLGYYNPDAVGGYYTGKRKDGDLKPMDLIVFGMHLPHWALHSPMFEALQMGATLRRYEMEQEAAKKESSMTEGVIRSALGPVESIPFISSPTRTYDEFHNAEDLSQATAIHAGNLVGSEFILPDFTKIAMSYDKIDGEQIARYPKGFLDAIELKIPGLRSRVKAATEEIMDKRKDPTVPKTKDEKEEAREVVEKREEAYKKLCEKLGVPYVPPKSQQKKATLNSSKHSQKPHIQ